jgi:hypothetical protein
MIGDPWITQWYCTETYNFATPLVITGTAFDTHDGVCLRRAACIGQDSESLLWNGYFTIFLCDALWQLAVAIFWVNIHPEDGNCNVCRNVG